MTLAKIALVSEEYPPHIHGGVGTFCYSLATWAAKRKIPTTVFTGKSKRLTKETVNEYLEIVRLPIYDIPPRHGWFQLQNFSNFSKYLTGNEYSIIHSISPEVSPICVYLKKKLRKPLITSYHGYTSYEMKAFLGTPFSQASIQDLAFNVIEFPIYDSYNRISIAYSDHIVTCSYAVLNEMRTLYKHLDLKRASVIYNGIDLAEFDNSRKDMPSLKQTADFTILFFGRWYWSKGLNYLIEAFKQVLNKYPNIQLRICGKGPMEPKILSMISSLNLGDKVQLLGHVSRHQLITEMLNADVITLPSLREAQPIAVLEAMACRKPVVVFNFPFVSEYIQDSFNGILAKAKDSNDLAKKIEELLIDQKLRQKIGENAYKYVANYHNWEKIADRYVELYKSIVE
jgi:1,4-alpha-glucan branching enzyme